MKKPRSILWVVLTILLLLLVTIPVVADPGGWTVRVTGQMSDSVDRPGLTISLFGLKIDENTAGGKIFHSDPVRGLEFHLNISRICFSEVPTGFGYEYAGQDYVVLTGKVYGLSGMEVEEGGMELVQLWKAMVHL